MSRELTADAWRDKMITIQAAGDEVV